MKQIYKQNKNEHKRQTNINQTQNTYLEKNKKIGK